MNEKLFRSPIGVLLSSFVMVIVCLSISSASIAGGTYPAIQDSDTYVNRMNTPLVASKIGIAGGFIPDCKDWLAFFSSAVGVLCARLPGIVGSGDPIDKLAEQLADEYCKDCKKLTKGVKVVACKSVAKAIFIKEIENARNQLRCVMQKKIDADQPVAQ